MRSTEASELRSAESRRLRLQQAAVVPHNAFADSLMESISLFVEENCDAEILEEIREIR